MRQRHFSRYSQFVIDLTKVNQNQAGRAVTLSLLGNGLAGTAGTAAALYPLGSSAAVTGFVRLSMGAVALLLLSPFFGGKLANLPRILTRPGVWIMAISSATYQALFFAAVDRSGVATAALVTVGCIPVSAGIVGWLFLRERPNRIWFIATTIAVSGLAVRSAGELQSNDLSGLLFAIGAGIGIGGYLNAAKVEVRRGAHPMQLPGLAYLIGSIGLFFIVRSNFLQVEWNSRNILLALYIGVITMGLANAFQIIGLNGTSPGVAATMMIADPLIAALLGIFVMGEVLTTQGAIGLALVIFGLVLQSFSPGENESKVNQARHE